MAAFLGLLYTHHAQTHPAEQSGTRQREVGRTTERELSVVLSSTLGSIRITKGESEKIAVLESQAGRDDPLVHFNYDVRNRIGYMDVKLGEKGEEDETGSVTLSDIGKGDWTLRLSDALPISLDLELGAGTGKFDFSGLSIKDLNITTGASQVKVLFDEPNKSLIENMNIESGVSTFVAQNLGNANFRRLRFQGGVGVYTLDFNGELTTEVDVDAEVGLGVLTIIIPPEVGARVFYDKNWISTLDVESDFHPTDENQYQSENYASARGKLNIRLDSGLGNIRIRRTK